MEILTEQFIRSRIQRRDRYAHKGDFGKVLIYAGSDGMAGAAVLCARAALKSGSGLVRFLLPAGADSLMQILQCTVPEATCVSFTEGMDYSDYDAIAAGPGLGHEPSAQHILEDIIRHFSGVLVLDADALNMISSSDELQAIVRQSKSRIIMTPHAGEARRLLSEHFNSGNHEGFPANPDFTDQSDRQKVLNTLSEIYYCIVVLKGYETLIGTDETVYMNTTGNPGMATGGSGDVLAGVIASLAGQGMKAIDAAACGAFIHGLAGDMAAAELGEMGMISSDIVNFLPAALRKLYPPS